ncbi:SO2930 family diheme c-type cytochrome [Kordiimonas sp.]|uniref:SO2930 family diheme c-type cytochrome n=1 Tax=Kordiimonas sp. TaxID=1970157 RepID=UPI003A905E5A
MFRRVLSKLVFGLCSLVVITAVPAGAEVNDAALMSARPAKLLSEYGLFSDAVHQAPAEGVVPYDLITPLFTDYAHKYRFVYVPKGQKAVYNDAEAFEFPVGTTLIKTFAYPADFREPSKSVRIIETRLLIHQEKGWNAWAYVWDEEKQDGVLKVAGKTLPVAWTDKAGASRQTNYVVPNKNQCKGCHTFNKEFTPIGPKARNLNKTYPYEGGAANQLAYWSEAGILTGAPAHEDAPKVPAMDDESADLNARARAYLDINCAHCHRLEGPASTSGLFLTWAEDNKTAWGYKKRPVAAGRGSGGFDYDIMPGKPEQSILIHRLKSTDPGVMMPEVGRTTVHEEGINLLKEWINSIE